MEANVNEPGDKAIQFDSIGTYLPGLMTYQVIRDEYGKMKFTFVSESVRQLTGTSPQEVLKDPGLLYNLLIDEDKIRISEAEEISMKNLAVFDIEVRSRNALGEIRWLHIRSMPRKTDDGMIIWDGLCADVTARKETEIRLAESEKNLRNVLASMADDFYAIDRNYQVIIINENARKALERSWGKPVNTGTNIFEVIPESEFRRLKGYFTKVFAGKKIEYEINQPAGIHPKWVYVSILPITDENGVVVGAHVTTKDISERKEAEEKIKQSEERYRLLIEQASDAIMITDEAGNFVDVNSRLCEMFGYSKEELLHLNVRKLIDPVQLKEQPLLFEELKRGKHVFSYRRMLHKNGTVVEVEANVKMIPDGRVLAIARDITERKKAEKLLKESEEKYRTLIEQASDPIMIYSLENGRILDYNNAFMTTTGYNKKDIEGLALTDLLFPDDLINQPLGFGKIRKGIVVHDERRAKKKDGSALPVELTSKLMPNGNVMVIARDATIRKKAEEAIRVSEETKRLIMNSALDAIITMDSEGLVTGWNPQAEKIFGWKESETIGKPLSKLIIPNKFKDQHKNGLERFLQTGKTSLTNKLVEMTAVDKKGKEFPVELSIVSIKQANNIFFCGFLRDISERKKAENQLIESKNRLRTILNTEPECIKLLGPEGELLDMNPAGLAMIEVDDLEQVKGQKVESIIDPPYREAFHKLIEDVFKDKSGKLEFEITGLKGTKRWMATHAVPLKDASGKIISLLSVTRDISEKKKAEDDLLREKNLSDSIINSLPGVFYLYDESGKLLRWNKNFEVISGYCAAELRDLHPLDFFEGEDKESVRRKITEVFEKGMAEAEAYAITKSNQRIPFYFTGWRIIYDGKPCLIGVGIELTERKKAEQEMLVANERFNLISRATNDFVWDAYLDINKVWWNDNYYTQLGWTKGMEIPGGSSWENHIYEKDKKKVLDRLNNILKNTNDSIWTDEYRFGKADGSYITVYDRGYIMRDDNGKAYRMIGAMTDISEMKKTEELLKKSYEDIRRLASHLEKVREEERINIAREIHDELGQQLTVLKMDISWLKKNIIYKEEKAKQKVEDLLGTIDNTIKTVRRISSELRPSVLDDLGLIAALEWLAHDFEKRSGIPIKLNAETNEMKFDSNINTALFRILQESLTNVVRHAEATEIDAVLKKENGQLLILIKDNGKGFVLTSIENKKTLGILGIQERVAMMGGEFLIDSTPGHGTTVKIKVPVSSKTEPKLNR